MYRPKNTPDPIVAPTCEHCHRSKVLTSDPDERWQCARWTCRNQSKPNATHRVRADVQKMRSVFVLLGAVEELRQTGQRALENLADDVATARDADELLAHLERGAENVVHAIEPVSDALRAFVVSPQSAAADPAEVEMIECARCGVWVVGSCKCGAL